MAGRTSVQRYDALLDVNLESHFHRQKRANDILDSRTRIRRRNIMHQGNHDVASTHVATSRQPHKSWSPAMNEIQEQLHSWNALAE
jgi:hypothetical protein